MAEDKQEEKFDFTAEGEALGYISLAQARLLAMQTARETPGNYGRRFRGVTMAFEVVDSSEDEDYYNITLSFRPEGAFTEATGREQFFIGKEGVVAYRQVTDVPVDIPHGNHRWLLTLGIGSGIVVIAAVAIGASSIFGSGPFGASSPLPPTTAPKLTAVPSATMTPNPTPVPTTAEIPVVVVPSTGEPEPGDTQIPTSVIPTVEPSGQGLLLSLSEAVIADANPARTAIDTIKFTLTSTPEARGVVDLSPVGVVVSYLDDDQAINCFPRDTPSFSSGAPSCSWSTNWAIGFGDLLDPGEQVDMKVNLDGLVPRLGGRKRFTIQVKPTVGPVVDIQRTTPPELKATMALFMQAATEESDLRITGDVIADANAAKTSIDTIKFTLTNSGEGADLSATGVVVSYQDNNQALNCQNPLRNADVPRTSECGWSVAWILGAGPQVDPGEQVDMTVSLFRLSPLLWQNKEFTIRVKPTNGGGIIVNRSTPTDLKAIMSLTRPINSPTATPVPTTTPSPVLTLTPTPSPTPTPAPVSAQGKAMIKGVITYNGKPVVGLTRAPGRFFGGSQPGPVFAEKTAYDPTTGMYSIFDVPSGEFSFCVFFDAAEPFNDRSGFGGDFSGCTKVVVPVPQAVVERDISVEQDIHLISPVDNQRELGDVRGLAPSYSQGPILFRWKPVPTAATYRITIDIYQESPYQRVANVINTTTSTTEFSPSLSLSQPNQRYQFDVEAYSSGGTRLSDLRIPYTNGWTIDYRFRVIP